MTKESTLSKHTVDLQTTFIYYPKPFAISIGFVVLPSGTGSNHKKPVLSFFFFMYMCVSVHTECLRDQKRASDPLKHGFHIVVSCLIWVLGVELQCSRRTLSALNLWATSPASRNHFLICACTAMPRFLKLFLIITTDSFFWFSYCF